MSSFRVCNFKGKHCCFVALQIVFGSNKDFFVNNFDDCEACTNCEKIKMLKCNSKNSRVTKK